MQMRACCEGRTGWEAGQCECEPYLAARLTSRRGRTSRLCRFKQRVNGWHGGASSARQEPVFEPGTAITRSRTGLARWRYQMAMLRACLPPCEPSLTPPWRRGAGMQEDEGQGPVMKATCDPPSPRLSRRPSRRPNQADESCPPCPSRPGVPGSGRNGRVSRRDAGGGEQSRAWPGRAGSGSQPGKEAPPPRRHA